MLKAILLFCGMFGLMQASLDMKFATLALWHSEASYCDPSSYLNATRYSGVLEGFTPVYTIYDKKHDTNGYIGYTASQKTIYVAFRGSVSVKNFITDLKFLTTSYPSCSDCNVHKGFYEEEQIVIKDIIAEVGALKQKFPSYSVVVTGHSLGAALASLAAIDLLNAGISPVRLFNFGSPRIGDESLVNYIGLNIMDHARITHHKDIVPHLPPHGKVFTHLTHEYYEPNDDIPVKIVECSGHEDPECSYQWVATNIPDHLWYMGVEMGPDGCHQIL